MTPAELEMTKRWVENWKVLGPMMERFRAEDLAALTDEAAARQFVALTNGPRMNDHADDGLIEQQRGFGMLASWKI